MYRPDRTPDNLNPGWKQVQEWYRSNGFTHAAKFMRTIMYEWSDPEFLLKRMQAWKPTENSSKPETVAKKPTRVAKKRAPSAKSATAARLERLVEGLGDQRTNGEVNEYLAQNKALIDLLPAGARATFDAKVEERRRAIQQPARRAGR